MTGRESGVWSIRVETNMAALRSVGSYLLLFFYLLNCSSLVDSSCEGADCVEEEKHEMRINIVRWFFFFLALSVLFIAIIIIIVYWYKSYQRNKAGEGADTPLKSTAKPGSRPGSYVSSLYLVPKKESKNKKDASTLGDIQWDWEPKLEPPPPQESVDADETTMAAEKPAEDDREPLMEAMQEPHSDPEPDEPLPEVTSEQEHEAKSMDDSDTVAETLPEAVSDEPAQITVENEVDEKKLPVTEDSDDQRPDETRPASASGFSGSKWNIKIRPRVVEIASIHDDSKFMLTALT
ncbi:protein piccolo-like [Ptychodera flava]|uniref:protein piccolo-like n=1 Tax=Ptychodera flava TaxID=63121 RepID=UPI00396A34F7